jgi:single-stranded-DNA-specific exonuclease
MKTVVKHTYAEAVEPEQVMADLLQDRGITDKEAFLQPKHPMDLTFEEIFPEPHRKTGWQKVLELLKKLHLENKPIVVYTDYDADGVTGGSIMWEALHKLGFNVMPYVPARTEGYGFSEQGIDAVIAEHKPALIISVDHGIVAHKEITYAAAKGVPIIVTDHHHMQDGEPADALAVFHTTDVSGSGVAYFFVKQLIEEMATEENRAHLQMMLRSDYLALAAIGTIADLIPLVGPARSLARYGLAALTTTSRMGIRNLIRDAGIPANQAITAYHVGFVIAPRLNAFGRLGHAMDAVRLLCTTSYERAVALSAQAHTINTERQKRVKEAVAQADKMVNPDDRIIILDSETWEEGIIGLIASKMLHTHYKPAIVMTRSDGHAKASVRSIDGVHITDFLKDLRDHLVDMGGHAAAAGFTIKTENIEAFTKAAREKATSIPDELFTPTTHIDVDMPLSMARMSLATALTELGPYGMGFKEPLFRSRASVSDIKSMGKTGSHLKVQLVPSVSNDTRGLPVDAVCFSASADTKSLRFGDEIEVVYTLDINTWNGRQSIQAMVKNIYLVIE